MAQSREHKSNVLVPAMVGAGIHEPLSFRRRTGKARTNEETYWAREHSAELVRSLAERGVNWVRTHFYKGNGLAAEAPEIELTRAFVELCHRHGIRVQLYTQFGTLQYETLLDEVPEMMDWVCINEEGQPVRIRYGHQDFRYKPCFVREGFWPYLRRVLELGLEEVRGDGFGFDNVEGPSEPDACHCPECRAAFVAFLKQRYPTDTDDGRRRAEERFGFAALDHVRPPVFNRLNPPQTCRQITSPVMQEWMEFRCENMRRRFAEIWEFVKNRRPEALIEYNVYPPYGKNGAFWQGIDMHRLGPWLDMFYNERDPWLPGFAPGVRFEHRVHGYKLAGTIGAEAVHTGTGGADSKQRRLAVAEALVFNQGQITRIGRTLDVADGATPEADALIAFRTGRPELFEGTGPGAEVAMVESVPTRMTNCVEPYVAGVLAINGLLAGGVPFDLIADPLAEDTGRYRLMLLPDVECMSDETAALLRDFVAQGGALVATGATACYDTWRRARPASALEEVFGTAPGYAPLADAAPGAVLRGDFGKGRFTWLRGLVPAKPFDGYEHCTDGPNIKPGMWRLAENNDSLLEALRWAGEGRVRLRVQGPAGLAAELRRAPDGRLLVHLLNFNLEDPAADVVVIFPETGFSGARLWSPWRAGPEARELSSAGGACRVQVGTVECYEVLELLS